MPSGGARPGAGQPPIRAGFRGWCRAVVLDPEVRALMEAEARRDPNFALKIAEHGFGRPSQALDIRTAEVEPGDQVIYRAAFEDGAPVFAEVEAVPEEPAL